MRTWLALFGIALTGQAAASESIQVDGMLVYGKPHAVSVNDIREAAAASGARKPVALEVLSGREIHVYPSGDLGWRPVCYCEMHEPDGSVHRKWSSEAWDITGTPAIFDFIRTADVVYVFPVATPLEPHRDDKHMRLLGPDARRSIAHLLGNPENWLHGFNDTIRMGAEPANIGLLFRQGKSELVMFFASGDAMQGSFKGESTSGSLFMEDSANPLESWERQYAQPELAPK